MIDQFADWFMGSLAIILGVLILATGVLNWERAFHLRKPHWLSERYGRNRARLILAALGAGLIVLGVAIVMDFTPNAGRPA